MQKPNILLINPSKGFYKKGIDKELKVKQLNFGILSIASSFPRNISIYDCQDKSPDIAVKEISSLIVQKKISIIGISLISAYSEKSAFYIADAIHKIFNNIVIIYGGKDHAPYIAKDLIESHHAKVVVKSYGEEFFKDILENNVNICDCKSIIYKSSEGKLIENKESIAALPLPIYDHTLYPDYLKFVPSIEVSRGCNKNCAFCTNNKTKQIRKSTDKIIAEIAKIKSLYGERACAYCQTPHFLLSNNDLKEIAQRRSKNDLFTWRTQTSVRYLTSERIQLLYEAGARAIDVGFESAAPDMLLHMGKDKKPKQYLAIMRKALMTAASVGLRLKLNILLFAGETHKSLTQTALFLKDNLHNFHSFSAYPVMVYPSPNSRNFISKIESEFGGSIAKVSTSKNIYFVNLSPQINHQKAHRLALLLGKSFQSHEMYISQRCIGYLPYSYQVNPIELRADHSPFYSSASEQQQAQSELNDILEGLV